MVLSLPGFLDLCLNVCSPSQVLWDVYTEVLEAAHPLHRGPTDHKRSVGPLLSLPEVHDQLFSFAHVQRETVVLAPWCKSLYLIQVCGLIIVVRVLSLRSSVIHGFVTEPWYSHHVRVFMWARGFECARVARSLVCVPCFMLERGVWIPALMSLVSVTWRGSDTRAPFSVIDWVFALFHSPHPWQLLEMRPRTTVSSANVTIEVELWEDTQSCV